MKKCVFQMSNNDLEVRRKVGNILGQSSLINCHSNLEEIKPTKT